MGVIDEKPQVKRFRFDSGIAARQAGELRRLVDDGELAQRATDEVIARRAELASERGRSATRIALQRLPGFADGRGVLAAAGELLVLGGGQASAVRLLHRRGFAVVGSAGPVTRLRYQNAGPVDLLAICDELRGTGFVVAPNYVAFAAPVGKGVCGLGGPLPTDHCPPGRPSGDIRASRVRVALIDTGIDAAAGSAGWLEGIQVDGSPGGNRDLLDAVPAPDGFLDEAAGHGTFVAGIVRQAAPACEVVALRALDSDGIGTDFSVASALFCLAHDPEVPDLINLSLTCEAGEPGVPVAMDLALSALTQRHPGTLIVAAAGNDGSTTPIWPAAHESVVAVGALPETPEAAYSNFGPWVDLRVPADGIVSTYVRGVRRVIAGESTERIGFSGRYAAWSGTSFAAAQVTGQLALLLAESFSPADAVAELQRQALSAVHALGRWPQWRRSLAGVGSSATGCRPPAPTSATECG